MTVANILNAKGREVTTARRKDTLAGIARTLSEQRIGSIVIVDDKGRLAGIVSERDVVRAIAEHGAGVLEEPVEKHMTHDVVTCSESDTIRELMSAMTVGRFRHMPVVNDGRVVGIISIGDVVKQRIAEAEFEAEAMRAYIATG